MILSKNLIVIWVGFQGELFAWKQFRYNGGGYLGSAAPYHYWRIGPVIIKRYL